MRLDASMHSDDAEIQGPCDEDWERMRPEDGGRRRWCERCERQVHDLSQMGEPAAQAFLRATADRDVCISYDLGADGAIVFANAPIIPLDRLRRRPLPPVATFASAASVALLLAACTPHDPGLDRVVVVSDPTEEAAAAPNVVIPTERPNPAVADPTSGQAGELLEEPCEPKVEAESRMLTRKGKRVAGVRARTRLDDPLGDL